MGVRQTSLEAYDDIQPSLGARQEEILNAIKKLGCPTNLEISKYKRIPINQVTPRTKELREMGLVVECEKRECGVSGRTAMTWRAVKK
jgi:predicted transcriptional regulator